MAANEHEVEDAAKSWSFRDLLVAADKVCRNASPDSDEGECTVDDDVMDELRELLERIPAECWPPEHEKGANDGGRQ